MKRCSSSAPLEAAFMARVSACLLPILTAIAVGPWNMKWTMGQQQWQLKMKT
jgi:hypothetical protein